MEEKQELHNITFKVALKTIPTEGHLVYEYNPFRNYRLDQDRWLYKNNYYTSKELAEYFGMNSFSELQSKISGVKGWKEVVPEFETNPVLYTKGQLVDFITDQLDFDLEHPVQLLPSYSYDNSVDLIMNDGKGSPKLINSRFSATERNKYKVNDRAGDRDTNIYDQDNKFKQQTSLYRDFAKISKFDLLSIYSGGNLKTGLYALYFAYLDADGNESDIFLETGPIQIYSGDIASPAGVHAGFRDYNSFKTIQYKLSNLDASYNRLQVYYSRATSDIDENPVTIIYKLVSPITYDNSSLVSFLNGLEEVIEVPVEDINQRLQRYSASETQEICQNRLFLGHNYKIPQNYREFRDIALRFLPIADCGSTYEPLSSNYSGSLQNTYYNPMFSYKKTGYWDDFYRFGIVFIQSDGTYSDVYDVRGCSNLTDNTEFSHIRFQDENDNRNYIAWDETSYSIISDSQVQSKTQSETQVKTQAKNENCKGVVKFASEGIKDNTIIGINFKVEEKVLTYLKENLKVRGFFFVRKKRIPTILCQAYTISIDNESNTPVIPYSSKQKTDGESESFLNQQSRYLTHGIENRLPYVKSQYLRHQAAICPEYDVNTAYYNAIFSGNECTIRAYNTDYEPNRFAHVYNLKVKGNESDVKLEDNFYKANIIGVEDNTLLVETQGKKFSARAGEAEEANKFKYVGSKVKSTEAINLIRGSFGPYLGIVGYDQPLKRINIYIPGYSESNIDDYMKIRYQDNSAYYSISEQFSIEDEQVFENAGQYKKLKNPLYRGDCFICNFTHRLNRNFQDPSAPTNDEIVDERCWAENFAVEDNVIKQENFDKINLGDINAVKMGRYVDMVVRSSINLNVRSLDDSNVDEDSLTGGPRTFVPHVQYPVDGIYKKPESFCYNKGLAKTTNERIYMGLPDVPFFSEDFTNRISYSEVKIKDSFENGFRIFKNGNYRDYPKTYGSIIKLLEDNGSLICVLEHGIYRIPINERAVAAEGAGGLVYINTSNILPENPLVISDKYGSQWKDSIIKTPKGIYGVDTTAKKIWRVVEDNIELISDFKIQKFLNDNISLTERELTPIIGVRNVKTHYNAYKDDVMFTFYDNLRGFEERVWNICWNEKQNLWTTFYSWLPSCSENIHNQYYSFDRNTSKWIAKLGVSKHGNAFSDGVTLSRNIIPTSNDGSNQSFVGNLYLDNRLLTSVKEKNITYFSFPTFEIMKDNYGNHQNFTIPGNNEYIYGKVKISRKVETESYEGKFEIKLDIKKKGSQNYDEYSFTEGMLSGIENQKDFEKAIALELQNEHFSLSSLPNCLETYQKLYLTVNPTLLCSELYYRSYKDGNSVITPFGTPKEESDNWVLDEESNKYAWKEDLKKKWEHESVLNKRWAVYKDEKGRRPTLPREKQINPNKIVTLLNIKATIHNASTSGITDISEAMSTRYANLQFTDGGYYESVVALCTDYNAQYLSTDFWKHGQAGIIDIADDIYPTYWYGKQHPFEFEFVVRDAPDSHKIFDNLQIISNNAAPESFHYEVIGDSYEFAKDKKNMYIRQEATKELYQYNGTDITYNDDYKDLKSEHRPLIKGQKGPKHFDKSTIFPAWYIRQDTINEIEDAYHSYEENSKNFADLAGAEIVRYKDLDEYRVWNHAKAVDIRDVGPGRGNMVYKEDKWDVQINPINYVQKNESKESWEDVYRLPKVGKLLPPTYDQVPAELNLFQDLTAIPSNREDKTKSWQLPDDWTRNVVKWKDYECLNKQTKMRDKFIKIRIRYSGKDLAVIGAIKTLYSLSYA